jgi:hypothetical protein
LNFEREDWSLFRTVEGLQQKAGVPKDQLAQLVLKELTDNALDEGADVSVHKLSKIKSGYSVEDDGRGLDGTPEEIARLFSINRPMVSTKLLRLPTRGALGNGLRVVAGAVLASGKGAFLTVITRNRCIELRPERDGTTTVVSVETVKHPVGTRIEIKFGPALPCDDNTLNWAGVAQYLALRGQGYAGKSSPWWYDPTQFHELLYASGATPVRELVAQLDGCTGGRAGEIVAASGLDRMRCKDVTRKQAAKLLQVARANARPVNPERLGAAGPREGLAYGKAEGTLGFGSAEPQAVIPSVVEAWAKATPLATTPVVCVNRTPITGKIDMARDKRDIDFFGCGLRHTVATAPKDARFIIWLNIITPYMPITSDGKAPDLAPFLPQITTAVGKAVKKAHRPNAKGNSQKDVVLENLEQAIADVSGDGAYRYGQRQLLYALRPIVRNELGEELQEGNFNSIITDYENENGDIPGMYREPRGSIYHPHRGKTITLGTLMVENYERPLWTFNKLLYIEKEGFAEALKEVRWAEQHDCAVMSSKGYSTRAARDLVDKLAEHDEPVTIYCVHDADAYGTMIYQTFQEETAARGARKVEVVNLGLEPWEAVGMGLEVEDVKESDRHKPVAEYVLERDDAAPDGTSWEKWLQTHRVELNAMTTPQFIAWLDGKMGDGKLVPPPKVLLQELEDKLVVKVRADITARILREANFEGQVSKRLKAIKRPTGAVLAKGVVAMFKNAPDKEWRAHLDAVVNKKA